MAPSHRERKFEWLWSQTGEMPPRTLIRQSDIQKGDCGEQARPGTALASPHLAPAISLPGIGWLLCRKKSVRPEGKEDSDELVRTIITGDHKALRDVRLCESMINDHGTEAYFRALGQDNPAHAEKVGLAQRIVLLK